MKKFKLVFIAILFLAIAACAGMFGEEVARVPINKISSDEKTYVESISIDMKAGEELALWTDLDIEYTGTLELEYQIIVIVDKEDTLEMIRFDAFQNDASFNKRTVTINNETTYSIMGRLGPFKQRKMLPMNLM